MGNQSLENKTSLQGCIQIMIKMIEADTTWNENQWAELLSHSSDGYYPVSCSMKFTNKDGKQWEESPQKVYFKRCHEIFVEKRNRTSFGELFIEAMYLTRVLPITLQY